MTDAELGSKDSEGDTGGRQTRSGKVPPVKDVVEDPNPNYSKKTYFANRKGLYCPHCGKAMGNVSYAVS
jgi:hypothetical protein